MSPLARRARIALPRGPVLLGEIVRWYVVRGFFGHGTTAVRGLCASRSTYRRAVLPRRSLRLHEKAARDAWTTRPVWYDHTGETRMRSELRGRAAIRCRASVPRIAKAQRTRASR